MKLIYHIFTHIEEAHPIIQLLIYGGIALAGIALLVIGKNNNYF